MKKRIFAICDLEENYARNLTEYLNERKCTPFEVHAFTNLESLADFAGKNPIELLLISTDVMCDEVKKLEIDRVIILSDGESLDRIKDRPHVYKYQASDSLIAEVMNYYAESGPLLPGAMFSDGDGRMKLVGVYSPLNRVGKTSFALTMGEILGEKQKVLYLNLEEYSGFEELFAQKYHSDISDLIYFARQKEGNLIFKINGMIQTIGKLDYIPPAFSPCDLREVHLEEWLQFIRELGACGEYDVLILDLGNQIEECYQILNQCKEVYMPVLEDPISRAKILQFEKSLRALELSELQEKIRKLHLPEWKGHGAGQELIERLVKGRLGDYIRRLLAEEDNRVDSLL